MMGTNFCDPIQNASFMKRLSNPEKIDIAQRETYKYLCPPLITFCLISVIINGLLIFIGKQSKAINKTPIFLLSLNLAGTDMVASLMNGITLLITAYLPFVHGTPIKSCLVLYLEIIRFSSIGASALHLLALAFVAYRGIVNPLHYRSTIFYSQHLSRTINIISVVCWLIPLAVITPWFKYSPCQGFQTDSCEPFFMLSIGYRFTVLALFAIPLGLMLIIYLRIFIIIRRGLPSGFNGGGSLTASEPNTKLCPATVPTGASTRASITTTLIARANGSSGLVAAAAAKATSGGRVNAGGSLRFAQTAVPLTRPTGAIGSEAATTSGGELATDRLSGNQSGDSINQGAIKNNNYHHHHHHRHQQHNHHHLRHHNNQNHDQHQRNLHLNSPETLAKVSCDTIIGNSDGESQSEETLLTDQDQHVSGGSDRIQQESAEEMERLMSDGHAQNNHHNNNDNHHHHHHQHHHRHRHHRYHHRHRRHKHHHKHADNSSRAVETTAIGIVKGNNYNKNRTQTDDKNNNNEGHLVADWNDANQADAASRLINVNECNATEKGSSESLDRSASFSGHQKLSGDETGEVNSACQTLSDGTTRRPSSTRRRVALDTEKSIKLSSKCEQVGANSDGSQPCLVARKYGSGCGGCGCITATNINLDEQDEHEWLPTSRSATAANERHKSARQSGPMRDLDVCRPQPTARQSDAHWESAFGGSSSGGAGSVGFEIPDESVASSLANAHKRPGGVGTAVNRKEAKVEGAPSSISHQHQYQKQHEHDQVQPIGQPFRLVASTTAPSEGGSQSESKNNAPSGATISTNVEDLTLRKASMLRGGIWSTTSGLMKNGDNNNNQTSGSILRRTNRGPANQATASFRSAHSSMSHTNTLTTNGSRYEPSRRHVSGFSSSSISNPSERGNNTKAVFTTLFILGTYFASYIPAVLFFALTCEGCPYFLFDLQLSTRIIASTVITVLLIAKTIIDTLIYSYRMNEIQVVICRFLSKRRSRSCYASGGLGGGGGGGTSMHTSMRFKSGQQSSIVVANLKEASRGGASLGSNSQSVRANSAAIKPALKSQKGADLASLMSAKPDDQSIGFTSSPHQGAPESSASSGGPTEANSRDSSSSEPMLKIATTTTTVGNTTTSSSSPSVKINNHNSNHQDVVA